MSVSNKLIGTPFAENAGDTWKYSIPNSLTSTDEPNKASYETGFPPKTMTPIEAGGIPFFGQDVNGILNETTTAIRFMQTGDYQSYNADFAKSIGGYPKDAQIKGSDGIVYVCTADGNTTDPTGLDGWQTFLSSATDSESETQAATSLAVKQAYDLAKKANDKDYTFNGGTVTEDTNFTGALQQNGNDVITTENVSSYQGLGYGQTWQDVLSSRVYNTVYINSTDKPIAIAVSTQFGDGGGDYYIYVDDLAIASCSTSTNYSQGNMIFGIVPAGSSYKVTSSTGRGLRTWTELR